MGSDSIPWTWRFRAESDFALAELLERENDLSGFAGVEVLKQNLARTVFSLPASADRSSLIVKRYHPRGQKETLKYLLLPSRAESEWMALCHFEKNGIAAPYAVAMGEARWGGVLLGACLVMEKLTDAVSLTSWLTRHRCDREARLELIDSLARVTHRMTEVGVDHRDFHAGNILVRETGGAAQVCVIDLHSCRLGAIPPRRRQRQSMAKLFHSLGPTITKEEGRRLATSIVGSDRRTHAALLEQARRLELTRLKSRTKRCLKTTSEFVRERRSGFRIHRRRSFPWATLEPLLTDPTNLEQILKDRPRQTVGTARVEIQGHPTVVLVKRRVGRGFFDNLRFRVGSLNPMYRAWWAGRALEVRRIPTPRTLALARPAFFSSASVSLLITEYVENAGTLRDVLLDRFYPPPGEDRSILRRRVPEFALAVRRLHNSGLYHRDLNPFNYLVVPSRASGPGELEFLLIDLDSIYAFRRLTRGRRMKNLVQLGLVPEGHIFPRDRLRFLYSYDQGEGRYWNRGWIRSLDRRLARETVQIIARLSRKERLPGPDPEITDPRFAAEPRGAGPR